MTDVMGVNDRRLVDVTGDVTDAVPVHLLSKSSVSQAGAEGPLDEDT